MARKSGPAVRVKMKFAIAMAVYDTETLAQTRGLHRQPYLAAYCVPLLSLGTHFQVPTTIDQRVVLVPGAAYVHVQTANNTKWAITMTFVLVWRARVEQQGVAPKAAFPQPAEA